MGNVLGIQISFDALFIGCINCTSRNAGYVSQLEQKLAAIRTEFQKLIEAKDDVMTRITNAEQQQQMRRLNKVQGWLSRVEALETEVAELIRDGPQEIDKLCLGGNCSRNCRSSYKFGKNVAKKLQLVATLTAEGAFEVVAEKVPEAAVDERPLDQPIIVGLESTFDKAWRCLGEEHVGIIGLYGMGGVGKTTLLTQINNKFLDSPNAFDVVIWVVVSKDLHLGRIQEKIGERIGLLENRSLEEKASGIFKILSKKKFLLLLDDIWERIDLAKVGVPFPSSKNASKVVFTTRLEDICSHMEAQKKFKVECLRDKEAWELFQEKVGEETLTRHHDIPKLAEVVAKECSGLPLALITTGRAMGSKKTLEEWRYAIEMLRRSAFEFPGMGKEVYPLLKFSYDSLPSDVLRSCLLYCSLFPEDYQISKIELIECWIGEEFLYEYEGNGVYNQGYYIVGVLVQACLLEEVGSDYVKMHDVIRDMALWIACEVEKEKENYLVSAGVQLTRAPEAGKWENVKRISLMRNKIEVLSKTPTCPRLITLFLGINRLDTFTSDFFDFMPSLKVLNLSKNRSLTELPSGISKLVSLECLNLSETSIKEMPNELKALTNLKCLNLEYTRYLHKIPQELICHFAGLRVLRMLDCGYARTLPRDTVLFGSSEILVKELITLKHLIVLSVTLKSFCALQTLLSSQMLQSCTKALQLRRCEDSKSLNILSLADLKLLEKLDFAYCSILEELKVEIGTITREPFIFNSLQRVTIERCSRLREVTWLVFAPNLKIIHIQGCYVMEEIISVSKLGEGLDVDLNPFAKLQYLRLQGLTDLRSIYWNALPFPDLLELFVSECPELKKLPLGLINSVKEPKISIRGEQRWWNELQWENEATLNAFLPCFESI